ncbi:hypothetical protein [Marinilabilia salmonicolor]|uniref:hypothetical protein n=1 Tax=Marinilabilia salmonicolor TaxID=989 RepID=UPI0002ED87A6|nr:hypothetical protein [Marinilabilia salmonicolor]
MGQGAESIAHGAWSMGHGAESRERGAWSIFVNEYFGGKRNAASGTLWTDTN